MTRVRVRYGGHRKFFFAWSLSTFTAIFIIIILYLYTFNLLISTGSLGSIFSVYTLALSPSF